MRSERMGCDKRCLAEPGQLALDTQSRLRLPREEPPSRADFKRNERSLMAIPEEPEAPLTELPAVDAAAFELRHLDPKKTRLFRVAGVTRLTVEGDRSWVRVAAARAFPLSDPEHYIGFLDG